MPDTADKTTAALLPPDTPTTALRGVGPAVAANLAAAGMRTLADLLLFFPRRHDEVTAIAGPADAELGTLVRLRGRVLRATQAWLPGRRSIVTLELQADDGTAFRAAFFNQPWLKKSYPPGTERWLEGTLGKRGRAFALEHPRVLGKEQPASGPIVVRYRAVDGVSEQRLRTFLHDALRRVDFAREIAEPLPKALGGEAPPAAAFFAMHEPKDLAEHEAARTRFALCEAVRLFRRVERARQKRLALRGPLVRVGPGHDARMRAIVPFAWTGDQLAAVTALRKALAGASPLGCLLHGDVGTGKTAVALDAAVATIDAGLQTALLAPTELLAEQHHAVLAEWLAPAGIRVELLSGGAPAAQKRAAAQRVADGTAQLVIGTHALLSAATTFKNLGLVIVDEQHRFGVAQRNALLQKGRAQKGRSTHVLVMTATPIPRTLALALFGDLDAIELRARPPGRRMPKAVFVPRADWARVVAAIARHVRRAGRVYVVCPRIGAHGEKGGAVRMRDELGARFPCGLVHGRQPASERQAVTAAFRSGAFPVLVGTSVLEVGVDVAEATLMVVAGADRFGIATLHQLRGRVGRSTRRGLCILTGAANARIAAVCRSADGFALAEEDLRLRGAGELLGTEQSGAFDFRALDPIGDYALLRSARDAVRAEA